jgi:4-diphosphocytidyl-2-C-methyl-D-erythritol kinase
LEPLADWEGIPVLLAKPKHLGVSTAWAYQAFRSRPLGLEAAAIASTLPQVLAALGRQDPSALAKSLRNDLEQPVLTEHAIVGELRQSILSAGALGSLMSGSGPSVFGIMPSLELATQVRDTLRRQFQNVDFWVTQFAPTGILLEPDPQSLSLI